MLLLDSIGHINKKLKLRNNMKNMISVLEKIHANKDLRKTCIPLFLGSPGLGKTKIIEGFAKEKGVNLMEIIASQLMPHEISGIAIPDRETKLMSYFDFDKLLNLKDGDIVLFDELLNANPMVLNALLTLLENRRMISGKPLADIMFIAAANPQGATILTPQIKERFIFYNVKFDRTMWARYMYDKYSVTDTIVDQLMTLIETENFENSRHNYYTPRSLDKAINMMLHDVITPYSKDLEMILSSTLQNTTKSSMVIGDDLWLPDEKMSWLKIKQAQIKEETV